MLKLGSAIKLIVVTCVSFLCAGNAVYAGPADIKPTPILNLQAGISDELIVSIRKGEVQVDDLITVFSEEEQKNLPIRIDQRFTPLCAASSGRNVKAIKQLIELGADVNAMCINNGIITNPLELAYRVFSQQETENEATKLLKSNGAKISDAWAESYEIQKNAMESLAEERRKTAAENLKILAEIFIQLSQSAISQKMSVGGSLDASNLSRELVSTTSAISKKRLQEQQGAEVVPLKDIASSSFHRIPFTHFKRKFFSDLESGQAWCSSFLPTEQLIATLKSMKATLVKMNRCTCAKAGADVATLPYVCGIPYAYKTPENGRSSSHANIGGGDSNGLGDKKLGGALVQAVPVTTLDKQSAGKEPDRSGAVQLQHADTSTAPAESNNFAQAKGEVKGQSKIQTKSLHNVALTSPARSVAQGADFDALGSKLPKTERYSYSCGRFSGEEMMASESTDNCIKEAKQYMAIQCFPGAAMNELNIGRLKCAVTKSRGAPQSVYRDQLSGAQGLIRKYSPECNPDTGCPGKENLGNN